MLLKKATPDGTSSGLNKRSATTIPSATSTGEGKKNLHGHSEDVRQSLDVLDRILSEFDDVGTDTTEDGCSSDVVPEHGPAPPPPVDRSLKPRDPAPELPRKTRSQRPGSGSSSPSSHEYQEINLDVGGPVPPLPEIPTLITSPTGRGGLRQVSEDRAPSRRHEEDGRRQPRRQRSEDARLRRDDISSSSGDLPGPEPRRAPRDGSRGRSRESARGGAAGREARHLRKSRSGEVEARRPEQQEARRRRSRSSDRWLDQPLGDPMLDRRLYEAGAYDPRLLDPRYMDPRLLDPRLQDPRLQDPSLVDPRLVDPRLVDPRLVDPRLVDPRLVDPRLVDPSLVDPRLQDPSLVDPRLLDPRYVDEPYPYPHPHDPVRFPHLMRYPHMVPGGPASPGTMSPLPPGHPAGPPFVPLDYPPYRLGHYDLAYPGDPMLLPFMAPPGPYPPEPPPPDYLHPVDCLPPQYLFPPPAQGLPGGLWGPAPHLPREDWPPPSPEQAQQLIHSVVRNPVARGVEGEEQEEARGEREQLYHPGMRPTGRRLTSIGHSDSSGLSSPSEERRHSGKRAWWIDAGVGGGGGHPQREAPSEFRVGEAVRGASPRPTKGSTAAPPFPSGKDSGFEEAPAATEDGAAPGGGRASRAGGAFIVSGVFNDSSRMFIPAPPSPTPDYDDDSGSDGNESDILQGSQFYVVSTDDAKDEGGKKKLGNRDSLSDDSLQNAPAAASAGAATERSSKASTPVKGQPSTPLQTLMKEFHHGLPPVDYENGFSDDSLEDSTTAPSTTAPSGSAPSGSRHARHTSEESLASLEGSCTSFDYMNPGEVQNSMYDKTRPTPGEGGQRASGAGKDRKDPNRKTRSVVSSPEKGGGVRGSARADSADSGSVSRQSSRESSQSSGSGGSKPAEKFEAIKHMLKEGLIEGLDESPPEFKPPPPTRKTEDRADSGLGTKMDESDRSDLSGTPPSLTSPPEAEARRAATKKEKDTVRSRVSITSDDVEKNRDEGDEVEILVKETLEVPPTPPPRDESMHWTPRVRGAARSVPSTPSTSKITPAWHQPQEVPPPLPQRPPADRGPHSDDIYGQHEVTETASEVSSAINGSLASQYSGHDADNPLTDREFLENLKNLEPRPRPDTLAVISEGQGSLSSRSSRSGRLLSRIADSVRSGSRTPTPSSSSSASSTRATTTKLTSTSRSSTRIHGDIIREPRRTSMRDSALPSPQEYTPFPSFSPSIVPLTRDGSGRFRSIEDLAEAASTPTQDKALLGKKKKHSTLPPNLTPADVKKENKELRRATSLMVGKKNKDGSEGSKFRFNIFRGFWRRKQYSFDNKV